MRLPDFLIIGGMRCGSTTLARILSTQPSIYIPSRKELHYFDRRNPDLSTNADYANLFADAQCSQLIGEATPDYFSTPGSIERISNLLPNVKLVLILRDPVQRVLSHHRFSVLMKREIEPLSNALELEKERLAHPIHEHDIFFSYLQRSRYIEHINHLMQYFDRQQLHVLFLEELEANSEKIVPRLFDFLEITSNSEWRSEVRISNQSSLMNLKQGGSNTNLPWKLDLNRRLVKIINSKHLSWISQQRRNKLYRAIEGKLLIEKPETEVITQLQDYFEPYNTELEEFLERRLPW